MLAVDIPGFGNLALACVVLDYNGTLALDGVLAAPVRERVAALARKLEVHVITADTFGKAADELARLPCTLQVLPADDQDTAKLMYVRNLGPSRTVAIGNGRNDRAMLRAAALGIAVIGAEGLAVDALTAANVVVRNVVDALDLMDNPLRLTATLRS
jgi:soluble P-type ATPase